MPSGGGSSEPEPEPERAPPLRRVLCGQKDPFFRAWRNASTMLGNRGYRTEEPPLGEAELLRRLEDQGDLTLNDLVRELCTDHGLKVARSSVGTLLRSA